MLNWILNNKEWVFSGIGVSILGAIIIVFSKKGSSGGVSQIGKTNISTSNSPGAHVTVQENDGKRRYNFYWGIIIFCASVAAFFTNPTEDAHMKIIQTGIFRDLKINEDVFYSSYMFFSEVIAYDKNGREIQLTSGMFGRVWKTALFNENLNKILNNNSFELKNYHPPTISETLVNHAKGK